MGWEQVVFPLTLINEYQGTIINFDYAEDSIRQQLNNETECTNFINQYIEGQYLDIQSIPSSETIIYEKDSYTITVRWANANTPNTPGIVINFKFPDGVNKITAMSDYSGYMSRMRYIKFGIAINEDTQRATCIIGGYCSYNNNYFCNIDGITFSVNVRDQYEQQLYEWIIPAKPDPQGATIKVNYYLPDYDYTYAKITYKQDSEPDSETDGKSVEILKDETSVNIEGLEEEKTYYFKIFTDKSESEAFPFLVPILIDYGNMIFNDNSEITVVNNNSSTTAITTPKFLVDTYKEKSTQSGYSYMNANANTWLIGPANKTTGYYHIFGWTLPTDKDIYIICQNDTGQNAYYVWIWWDGLTSRDMLGTNCGYSKWFVVSGSVIYYESGTALNNYSSFNNNLIVNNNRYWSQTWLGGSETIKPIVWTEVSTSRIWVNGQKLT